MTTDTDTDPAADLEADQLADKTRGTTSSAPATEHYLRSEHTAAVERLADLRARKATIAEQIRDAVRDEQLLARAVRIYEKAADK